VSVYNEILTKSKAISANFDSVYLSSQFEKKLKMIMRRLIPVSNQTTPGGKASFSICCLESHLSIALFQEMHVEVTTKTAKRIAGIVGL
jgi:hypothetical protein